VAELTERIETVMTLLNGVPGISDCVAVTIIAEARADMPRIPTARTWLLGRVMPRKQPDRRSGGIDQSRPGNARLKAALGNAVMGAARTNGCHLQSRYRRRATRSTALKALIATEHAIIISIWHMLTTRQPYQDLGADYYLRRDPEVTKRRISRQAIELGLTVRFDLIEQVG
jgi:transposase